MGLRKYFSARHGYKPPKVEIQLESMDADLRTALWNAMCQSFWPDIGYNNNIRAFPLLAGLLYAIWTEYFKSPLDELPTYWQPWAQLLKPYVFDCQWHEVYEFIEFMIDHWGAEYDLTARIFPIFNKALENELAGYRIVGGIVTPITNKEEIGAIEDALETGRALRPVQVQMEEAVRKLSDRHEPDYRGSIKDSIGAVETICRLIANEPKLDLRKALRVLEQSGRVKFHGALASGFSSLYGWTSDDQGIRHGLMDEPNLTFDDAKYMLVSCSAFVNYLKAKAADAGLKL